MSQPQPLPHDPYITAVTDALTAAGLDPTEHWTDSGELDRYRDDDLAGLATMLTAVLVWEDDHPALTTEAHRHGIALLWEHPVDGWLWAPHKRNGHLDHAPKFLPGLDRYADPAAVVDSVRALLTGHPVPTQQAPAWHQADTTQAAVDAWTAAEEARS
ncbi:hypothetical protein [Streptomyces sp. NPDC006997]|uniref:hypothetical protein n=1 Tax=Streptomyces sp. NPDC006997 TaxID=3155356 RepID=UPI0033C6E545